MSRYPCARWLLLTLVAGHLGLAGLSAQENVQAARPGMVIVAEGAGDSKVASDGFAHALEMAGLPWKVRRYSWTATNPPSMIKDLKDNANHQAKGAILAEKVLAQRAANPHAVICLAGYSSGCAVVLAAADSLPPGSVDCIVLLAPSVSVYYDLRPALLCSRCGVRVYYSSFDSLYRVLNDFVSPPDQPKVPFAGSMGFLFQAGPGDELLAKKLKQYYWHQGVSWTGHTGNHAGFVKPKFIDYAVVPHLIEAGMAPAHK